MEPGATSGIFDFLVSMGLPGIVIIGLGYFNLIQYRRNNELSDLMMRSGQETAKALETTSASITRLTDLLLRGRGADA